LNFCCSELKKWRITADTRTKSPQIPHLHQDGHFACSLSDGFEVGRLFREAIYGTLSIRDSLKSLKLVHKAYDGLRNLRESLPEGQQFPEWLLPGLGHATTILVDSTRTGIPQDWNKLRVTLALHFQHQVSGMYVAGIEYAIGAFEL
jgi:hypothetical protein